MALKPGDMLTERLRLVRQVGEGGTGIVWVAENVGLGSRVAVKVLHGSLLRRPDAQRRFVSEARAMAQIDNPHVVKVFDIAVASTGEPYMVMELLSGEDLKERLARLGRLSVAEVSDYVTQACSALAVAHARGIIHRDIKPANLMLVATHRGNEIKVLDFGIAKNPAMEDLGLTQTSHFLGTPYYMSPEQMVSPKHIDHRADLWSLAVVAYELITGQRPFPGDSLVDISIAVERGSFPPPSSVHRELPASLDRFFQRALARDITQRPQRAEDLVAAIQAAAAAQNNAAQAPAAGDPDFAIKPTALGAEQAQGFGSTVAIPQLSPAQMSALQASPAPTHPVNPLPLSPPADELGSTMFMDEASHAEFTAPAPTQAMNIVPQAERRPAPDLAATVLSDTKRRSKKKSNNRMYMMVIIVSVLVAFAAAAVVVLLR